MPALYSAQWRGGWQLQRNINGNAGVARRAYDSAYLYFSMVAKWR